MSRKSDKTINSLRAEHFHRSFLSSDKGHILMISNHGIHQWNIVPGLPDTGGQNVYVNQFSDMLAKLGFRITIANRGGYKHPITDEMHRGLHYKNDKQRILYVEDDKDKFMRKEDMNEQIPKLAQFLFDFIENEGTIVDLIISHYWDGFKLGIFFCRKYAHPIRHIWVPHSLGVVKKQNMDPSTWEMLRIDERIEIERSLLEELDGVVATSTVIRKSLQQDYSCKEPLFLPPCIDTERFYPRQIEDNHSIWKFLSDCTDLPADTLHRYKIVTEISRTDHTKRKDVLIKAFTQVQQRVKDCVLIISIDETEEQLSAELHKLIDKLGIRSHTVVIGHEHERLPDIYRITDVYCSPSVMEGFGMSVQEAAATGVPVVSSRLIPFAVEYLAEGYGGEPFYKGKGAIVVQADDVDRFSMALEELLENNTLRSEMGRQAYRITIPEFTWEQKVKELLSAIDSIPTSEKEGVGDYA